MIQSEDQKVQVKQKKGTQDNCWNCVPLMNFLSASRSSSFQLKRNGFKNNMHMMILEEIP